MFTHTQPPATKPVCLKPAARVARPTRRSPIVWLALAGFALAACEAVQDAEPTRAYVISGDVGDVVSTGEAVLSRSTRILGNTEDFASVPIVDGRFRFEGIVSPWPTASGPEGQKASDNAGEHALGLVFLVLLDAEGKRKGQARFILEPGETLVENGGPAIGLLAHGGAFNNKVIASWRDEDGYQTVLGDYSAAMAARGELAEDDEQMETLKEESVRLYQEHHRLRREALRAIVTAEGDPLASVFAIELGGMGREEALARLDELEPLIGDFEPLLALRSRLETGVRLRNTAKVVQAGAPAPDFSAPALNGESHAFSDAIANSRYVLLEFWASWCGPCRAEYPHLKEAYERYHEDGFEVFAFSLDEDKDDWAVASEEDGIPWINTGDLSAYDSPVTGLYGVLAIPMSYLVDGDGVIVAKNLRGDDLHAKLAELFET